MSLKSEAIKRFLIAARSLANQGLSKEAIINFAKNEFGEITELFQKQIDNIFKRPASGIEKIKVKDEVFDDTVVKLPIDDQGKPFNPRNPLKQYDKPKKTDEFNLSEDDPLGDLEKIIKGEDNTGLPKNPRDKKYTGGIVDVEPSLSDIGHGSDALMARTRLLSPNNMATTSTGLNYLLAEDNDNIRVPFSKGKLADKARRKFMKTVGTGAAGLAALKAGLINLVQDAGPKVEMVKETITGTPNYFFDLVAKIKLLGEPKRTPSYRERVNEYQYTGKDGNEYLLTEELDTGDMMIQKDKIGGRSFEEGSYDVIEDRTEMVYKKGRGDETTQGTPPDEYEEYKVEFDQDGTAADATEIDELSRKEIIEEASEKITKKASGGLANLLGE